VRVVHPGLDLDQFDHAAAQGDAALRRQLLKGHTGPLLVHVGRITEGKGHRDLIPVIARLRVEFPGIVMLCVGDGPDITSIESQVAAAGLAGSFHFARDRSDVPAILRVCDLMLFPSHSEGFGLAPLEAMAAALPVVSNRLPSVEEFIGEGGVLVPLGDSGAMATASAALLRDPSRLRSMGHAGRRIVEQGFTVHRFVQQHESLYSSVVATHSTRSHP
jgi:glycosyltransferase involved in cell wall biosynthesis